MFGLSDPETLKPQSIRSPLGVSGTCPKDWKISRQRQRKGQENAEYQTKAASSVGVMV